MNRPLATALAALCLAACSPTAPAERPAPTRLAPARTPAPADTTGEAYRESQQVLEAQWVWDGGN